MDYAKIAYANFYQSIMLLAQVAGVDPQLSGPNVVVEPMEPVVQKAIELLKRMDPNYFSGVKKIVVAPASMYYGFVESGPDKDPSVINVNMAKIKAESGGQGPAAVVSAATTIAHERGHVGSFDDSQGFVGGESPADAEEQRVAAWIRQNQGRLQDLLGA